MAEQSWRILVGDCRKTLAALGDGSVQTVVTSPPYFGLRDYDEEEQIGLEETPQEYVAALLTVFAEVWRVLRDDGTVWLNLGDSYNDSKATRHPSATEGYGKHGYIDDGEGVSVRANDPRLKPKDMIGIPWRVAFALQDAGWYLRSEIIWAKPNPMPESVKDRPTKAHEQVFLLTKRPTYFYDRDAIREPHSDESIERVQRTWHTEGHKWEDGPGRHDLANSAEKALHPGGRNKRSVWEIATVPYKKAHFATFPPKLVIPCVSAGSPEHGSCSVCLAPWTRIARASRMLDGEEVVEGGWDQDDAGRIGPAGVGHWRYTTKSITLGWRPTCVCNAPPDVRPDDLDLIESPTGDGGTDDPSMSVGRAGYSRPRGDGAGKATMTRFQQRGYARQMRALEPDIAANWRRDLDITEEAWKHYVRLDAAGGRPLPEVKLRICLGSGLLDPVEPPDWTPPPTVPATVLDPFAGAATTGMVAMRLGRSFVGVELNPAYAEQARDRIREDAPLMNVHTEAETPGALA